MTKPLEFPIARRCPFDPPEEYARLRAEEPIARALLPRVDQEVWLVTRHDHVRALLTDPRLSSDRFDPRFPQHRQLREQLRKGFAGASKALIGLDLPEHTAPRRMVVNEFTMRRVNELRPRIQEIVDERIDAMLAGGNEADLWTELAAQVPAMTISELLGVPDERREFFQRQTEVLLEAGSSMEAQFAASGALNAFMEDLITGKGADPGDDLLGRLIVRNRETGVFTHAELVGMAMLLLVAGTRRAARRTRTRTRCAVCSSAVPGSALHGGWAGGVGVSGVGAGDAVAEVALDPGEGVWRSQWVQMLWEATHGSCSPMRFHRWS